MSTFVQRKGQEDRLKILNIDKNSFSDALLTSSDNMAKTSSTKWKPTEKYQVRGLDPETTDIIHKGELYPHVIQVNTNEKHFR